MRTPVAAPCGGSRLTSDPGRPTSDAGSWGRTTCTVAAPRWATTATPASSGAASSRALASRWSRRPPWPPTTTMRSTPAPRARCRARARSVASLASGWRSTVAPAASASASDPGSTESRSPTTTCTASPSARAWASPESAATTRASPGSSGRTPGGSGSPPASTTATRGVPGGPSAVVVMVPCAPGGHGTEARRGSLRRHDPDQVVTVGGGSLPLSPVRPGSRVRRSG